MSNIFKPSAYTPFLRRFTDERSRELRAVQQHYELLSAHQRAFRETKETIGRRVFAYCDTRDEALRTAIAEALYDLLSDEEHIWELPAPDFAAMTLGELVEYKQFLHRKHRFFANAAHLTERLYEGLARVLGGMVDELPVFLDPSPFTIPFVHALSKPREVLDKVANTLRDYYDEDLFQPVSRRLYLNMCAVNGRDPTDPNSRKPLILPSDSTLPLGEWVDTFAGGTPFQRLLTTPVPLKLTHEDRFNHWHVCGGSGAGKTTLIENLIWHDLASDERPTIILIDPHSDLVRKLARSDLGLDPLIIDPRDTEFPVALSPFAVNRERLGRYDEATREQVTAGVIQTLGYLWHGVTNLALTGKQDVFFRYVTRLLLTLPDVEGRNATIIDMLELMRDPTRYGRAIAELPPIPREFFRTDFMAKTFEGTKEQIRYRIQAIIENPTMARLFSAERSKVDFFTEMNRPEGGLILIDTASDFLKDASSVFGKLMVALILQAVMERAAIDEAARRPVFLVIDEVASIFSTNIDDLLVSARKYRCGLLLAHQFMDQASHALRASLSANTGIKFASRVSSADARAFASDMRCTPDFIQDQPRLQFAAYIQDVTPQAVSIPVRPVTDYRKLSPAAYEALVDRNRQRVSIPRLRAAAPDSDESTGKGPGDGTGIMSRPERRNASKGALPELPNEDFSTEW